MLFLEDILENPDISDTIINAFKSIADSNYLNSNTLILEKAPNNNDINGSQHHPQRINFGYNDANESSLSDVKTLGYYDYFFERVIQGRNSSEGKYTGNQYERYDGAQPISAIVINPPDYAADIII